VVSRHLGCGEGEGEELSDREERNFVSDTITRRNLSFYCFTSRQYITKFRYKFSQAMKIGTAIDRNEGSRFEGLHVQEREYRICRGCDILSTYVCT
jgi:hypothetical protein